MARASITALCLFCGQELSGKQKSEGFCSPLHALEYYESRQKDDDLGDAIFRDDEERSELDQEPEPAPQREEPLPTHLSLTLDPSDRIPIDESSTALPLMQQLMRPIPPKPSVTNVALRVPEREVQVVGPLTTMIETQFLEAMMASPPKQARPMGLLIAAEPLDERGAWFPKLQVPAPEASGLVHLGDQLSIGFEAKVSRPAKKDPVGSDLRPAWSAFQGVDSSAGGGHGHGKIGLDFKKLIAYRKTPAGKPDLTMPVVAIEPTATQPLPIPDGQAKTNSFKAVTGVNAVPPQPAPVPVGAVEKLLAKFGRKKLLALAVGLPVVLIALTIPAVLKKKPDSVETPPVVEPPTRAGVPPGKRKSTPPATVATPPGKPFDLETVVEASPDHERTLRAMIDDRKAIEMADDFHMGLSNWTSRKGGPDWRYDPTGFVIPRSLSLLKPSLEMKDYSMEFLTKIDVRAVSWVVRASDFSNYNVVKLVERAGGPLPKMTLEHYSVIAGRAGARKEVRLPMTVYKDTLYRVRMDIRGSLFAVWIQGTLVDSWTEERLPVGGIGFFNASGESARIRWVQLTHQNDMMGKIFAYIAPLAQAASKPEPASPGGEKMERESSKQRSPSPR